MTNHGDLYTIRVPCKQNKHYHIQSVWNNDTLNITLLHQQNAYTSIINKQELREQAANLEINYEDYLTKVIYGLRNEDLKYLYEVKNGYFFIYRQVGAIQITLLKSKLVEVEYVKAVYDYIENINKTNKSYEEELERNKKEHESAVKERNDALEKLEKFCTLKVQTENNLYNKFIRLLNEKKRHIFKLQNKLNLCKCGLQKKENEEESEKLCESENETRNKYKRLKTQKRNKNIEKPSLDSSGESDYDKVTQTITTNSRKSSLDVEDSVIHKPTQMQIEPFSIKTSHALELEADISTKTEHNLSISDEDTEDILGRIFSDNEEIIKKHSSSLNIDALEEIKHNEANCKNKKKRFTQISDSDDSVDFFIGESSKRKHCLADRSSHHSQSDSDDSIDFSEIATKNKKIKFYSNSQVKITENNATSKIDENIDHSIDFDESTTTSNSGVKFGQQGNKELKCELDSESRESIDFSQLAKISTKIKSKCINSNPNEDLNVKISPKNKLVINELNCESDESLVLMLSDNEAEFPPQRTIDNKHSSTESPEFNTEDLLNRL